MSYDISFSDTELWYLLDCLNELQKQPKYSRNLGELIFSIEEQKRQIDIRKSPFKTGRCYK